MRDHLHCGFSTARRGEALSWLELLCPLALGAALVWRTCCCRPPQSLGLDLYCRITCQLGLVGEMEGKRRSEQQGEPACDVGGLGLDYTEGLY